MFIRKKGCDETKTQDEKRPSSCAVQLDENYKRLALITNYTIPEHPSCLIDWSDFLVHAILSLLSYTLCK